MIRGISLFIAFTGQGNMWSSVADAFSTKPLISLDPSRIFHVSNKRESTHTRHRTNSFSLSSLNEYVELDSALSQLDTLWQTSPYAVAAVVCGAKASAADYIAQQGEQQQQQQEVEELDGDKDKTAKLSSLQSLFNDNDELEDDDSLQLDTRRNLSFIIYGALYQGIAHEYIFNHLYPMWFGTSAEFSVIAMKVCFNVFIQATFLTLPVAYLIKACLAQESLESAYQKYFDDVIHERLLLKCWSLWGPTMIITFTVIPDHWRVTFVAFVSFFWLILLSGIANKEDRLTPAPSK